MRVYHDEDADLGLLEGKRIAVLGYGNQGRAQALNLRDSGLEVIVGNREDAYAARAREDGLPLLSIEKAAASAEVLMLLLPDEITPQVFEAAIKPHLGEGNALVFASGYNVAFGFIPPPPGIDVVLVAPRMIGAGVRDLYIAGRGFPSFVGVAQDATGQARGIALALAKGIGSTRMGVVEVTFAQETELDLFTEQCFGPAFGQVLTTAVNLLLDEGYPPEAVLLELYMSGEFSYTLAKIAEMGLVEQSALHSRTSQYGSMSRGMRFILPELRQRMEQGLEEIRSGAFAQEWAEEQAAGNSTLEMLRETARSLPLHKLEGDLRQALRGGPGIPPMAMAAELPAAPPASESRMLPAKRGFLRGRLARLRRLRRRQGGTAEAAIAAGPPPADQMEAVLQRFLADAVADPALLAFSRDRAMTIHFVLKDLRQAFYTRFEGGRVEAGLGAPDGPAQLRLEADAEVLDGVLSGRINAVRAAMTGKLSFSGEARQAMGMQQIQGNLSRLYVAARRAVLER